MHYFVTEMSTRVHISITKLCIVGYGTGTWSDMGLLRCGIVNSVYLYDCHSTSEVTLKDVCKINQLYLTNRQVITLHVLLRQNDAAMSFWRNNDVIITLFVRWESVHTAWDVPSICVSFKGLPNQGLSMNILNALWIWLVIHVQTQCRVSSSRKVTVEPGWPF